MATLTELRAGLATRLRTIAGLHVYEVMPPAPLPPAAAVLPTGWDYHQTFDGMVRWRFDLWIYLNPSDLPDAQRRLDEYLAPAGTKSVAAAVDADPSLGLAGVSAGVQGAREYGRLVDVAGSSLLGGALQVEVMA